VNHVRLGLVVVLVAAVVIVPSWPVVAALVVAAAFAAAHEIADRVAGRDAKADTVLREKVEKVLAEHEEMRRLVYSARPSR